MSPRNQHRLLPLDEAARATRRSTDELRQWCATGRLRCDRVDGEWLVLESELHLAATMPTRLPEPVESGREILALAFGDREHGLRAADRLRARFDLGPDELATAPLSLDGRELMLVAGSFLADHVEAAVALARELGGLVVDEVDEARTERAASRQTERGLRSYG